MGTVSRFCSGTYGGVKVNGGSDSCADLTEFAARSGGNDSSSDEELAGGRSAERFCTGGGLLTKLGGGAVFGCLSVSLEELLPSESLSANVLFVLLAGFQNLPGGSREVDWPSCLACRSASMARRTLSSSFRFFVSDSSKYCLDLLDSLAWLHRVSHHPLQALVRVFFLFRGLEEFVEFQGIILDFFRPLGPFSVAWFSREDLLDLIKSVITSFALRAGKAKIHAAWAASPSHLFRPGEGCLASEAFCGLVFSPLFRG